MKKYLAFETQDGEFDVEEGRMDAFREKYPEARQIRAFDTPDGEFDVTPERMDAFRAKYPEAKELFHYEDDSGEEWDVGEDRVQAFAEAQPSLMMQPAEAAARRDAAAARAARAHDREVLRENAAAMADVERARSASRQQAVDDREAVARGKENQAAAEAARSRSRSEFIRKREWDRSAVGKTVGVLGAAGKGAVDAAAEVLTQIPRGIGKGMQSAAEREANPAGAPMTYGEVREKAKLPFDEKMHKPTDPLTDQDLRALQTAAPGLYDEAMARLRNQTVGAERADAERKAARGRAVEEKFTLTEPWNPKEHSKAENFAHGFAGGAAKMPYYAATGGLGMYAEGIDRGESPVDAAGEAAVWGAPLLRWLRVRPGNATGGALAHAAEAAAKSAGSAAVAGRDVSAAETLGAAAMGAVIGGVGGHAAGKAERQANAAGKATGVWVDAKGPDGRPIVGGDGKPIQVNLGRAEEAVRNAQQAVEEMGVGMKDANGNRIRVTKDFIQGKGPQPTKRGQYLRDLNRRPWAMVPEGILRGVPPRERIGTTAVQPGRAGAEAPRFEPRELEAPRPGLPLEQRRLGLDPEQGGVPHLYGTRVHPMQNKEPGSYVLPMDGPEGPSATRELQGILLGRKPDGATDAEWKAATGRAFVEAYGRRRGELSLDEKIEAVGTLEGAKPDAETSAWIKEEKERILDETIAAPVYSEEQAVLRRLAELEKLSPAERNRRTSVEAFHAAQLAEGMDANHVDSLLTWGHDPSTGRFGIFAKPTDKNDPLYDWMRRNEKDKTVSRVVFGANHSTAGNDVLAREIAQAMPQYGFDPDDPYIAEKIADRLKQEYEAYQDWKERGAPTAEREIQDREEIDHYAGREREPAEVDSEIVRGHVDAEPENRASQEAEAWRETDPEALEAWEESEPYAEKNPDGTVNGEDTQPGNGVKGNPQGEGEIPSAEDAMASYDPQTREIFEADYSEDPAQLDAEEFRLTSGPVQTMFDFTPKDAAAFPVRPTENKAKAMELRREESELLRRIRKNVGGLLALNISKDFKEWGGTSLVGKRVTSPRDLAAVSQMLRSPLFETFYIVFTKGGQVVYSTAHTSRMAGISAGPTPNEMQDIFARFRDMGADRWYVMHNHPSGDVTASGPDEKLTDYLTAKYGGQGSFGGHIILDHTKFGLISYDASGKRSFKKMPIGNTDGLENQYRVGDSAILPDPTLGKDLRGEANTVNVLREIVRTVPIKKDRIVMVGSDSQWHVKSISAVPPGLLEKTWKNAIFEISRFEYRHPLGQGATPSDTPRKMYDLIRNYSSNTGSRYLFLANVPEKYVNAVRGAIDYGVVFTAVDQKGNIIHGHGNARGETLEDTLHFDEISKNLWKNGLDGGSFLAEPTTEFRSSRSTASAMRPIDPATGKLAVWNADAEYAEANAIRAEIDAAAASGTPPADPAAIVARTQAAAEALRAKHEYAGANKLLAYAGLPTAPSPLLDPVAAGARTEAQVRAGLTPQANIVYSEIVELLRKWGGGRIPVQADRWIRSAAGRIAPEVAGRITLAPGGAEKVQIRRQPYADGTNPFGLVGMAQEKSLRDLAQAEVAAAVTAGTIRLEDAPKALEENFRVKMENAARDNAAAGPGTATAILLHEFGHLVDSMPQSMMDRGNVLGHIGALYKYLKQGIGTNFGDTGPTEAAKKDYFQRRMKSWKASHPGVSDADARAAARRETNAWIESRGWARRADVANEIDGLLAWYHQSDGMPKYYEKPAEMYAEAFAAWMFWPLKARLLAPTFDRLMTEWGKAHGGAAWKAVEKLRNMGTIVDAAKNAAKDAASKEFFEDIRDRMRTNTAAWDAAMNLEDPEERLTLGEKLEWLKWALVGEAEPVRALARKAGGWGNQSAAAVLGSMNRYQHWEGVSRKELYGIRSKVLPIVADAGLNLSDLDMFLWARRVATEILGIEAKGGRMNLANWGGVIPGDVRTKYGNAPTSAAAYLHTLQDADPAKFDALERAAEEFRKVREDTVLAEMRESGAFGAEALAALAGNETYVRFMNLTGGGDQVDLRAVGRENVLSTWTGIHRQGPGSGTHEVGVSPTLATVIGDKEIIRRCRLNRARMELGKFLIDNFPDKTMQPLVAWKDGHRQIVQRASAAGSGRRWKTLVWMEDGHERGVEIPEQYLRALEGTYRGDDPATQLVQKAAAMANASLGFMTNFSYVFNPRNWWKDKENIIRLMPAPDRSNWIQRNVGRIDAAWNIVKGPDFAAMLRDGRYNETLYRFMDILPRGIQSSWAARKQPVLAEIMRALGDGTQVDETALGNVLTTMGLGDAFKRQMRREMSVVGKMTDAFAKAFWLSQAPNRFWQKGEVNNKIAVRAMLEREHPGWNPDRLDEIAEKRVGTPDPTDQPGWFQHNPLANSLLAFWNMNIHGLVDQFLGAVRDDPKTFGKRYAMWGLGKALRNHGGKLMVAAALPIAAWATDQLRKLERDGKGESVEADMLRGIVKAKDKIVEDAILMEQIPSYDKFAGTIVMPKWLDKDRKVVAYGMIPTDPTFIVTDVALAAAFDSLGASLLGMEPGAPLTEIPANATGSVSGSAGPMLRLLVATVGGVDPGRQWKSIYRDGDAQGPLSREYLETVYNIMTASTLGLYRAGSSERAPGDEPTTPVEEYYPFVKAILPFVKVSNGGSKEIGARIREEGKRRSLRKQETVRTVLQGKEASERDAAEWLMGTMDANADVKRAAIEAEKRRTMSPAERAAEDQPVKLREDVERRYLLERQPGIRGDEWD